MKKSVFARLSAVAFPLAFAASVLLLAPRAKAATFIVNRAADDTRAGSLRFAIGQANAAADADIINFTLTGGTTISLGSNLPAITQPVTINGYSQVPTAENTLTTGATDARPPIELTTAGGAATTGLNITGNGSVIRGLLIHGFTTGILLAGDNNAVGGCFIGTNTTGAAVAPTTNGTGISISGDTNAVGGVSPGVTTAKNVNVISGNTAVGIAVVSVTGGVTVFGNLIGTNALGTAAIANNVGVQTSNSDLVLIGGSGFGEGNIVSGNASEGIQISNGATCFVQGNTVGLGVDDSTAIPNGGFGVELFSCTGGTVGGTSAERNIVSKNGSHGIVLFGTTTTSVARNFVGTDGTGQLDRGNVGDGIHLFRASNNNIGNKTGAPNGNLICANDGNGIAISGDATTAATNNTIEANFIGENAAGNVLGNDTNGIQVGDFTSLTKIGTAGNGRNYIQGNGSAGVLIQGTATTTTLLNNYIGTDSSGTAARGNGTDGVSITSNGNTLGDNTVGGRNLISGNPGTGVSISGGGNRLLGNIIGLNALGTLAIGNGQGVALSGTAATGNFVGDGTTTSLRNIVSGNADTNAGSGILIESGANGNFVYGCLVGLNAAGTAVLPNRRGIVIQDSPRNVIGGAAIDQKNVVGGHEFGVGISGTASTANTVSGNRIGTTLDGNTPLSNDYGIGIANGPTGNTIGGDENALAGSGNLISGNINNQILMVAASGNTITGNLLGTRADGLAALGNLTTSSAISIQGGSSTNVIGGTGGLRNVISGNAGNGIYFQDGTTTGNIVYGNFIGVGQDGTTSVPNGAAGIIMQEGPSRNLIGATGPGQGNIIANNLGDGVTIHPLTTAGTEAGGNSIRGNSIFNNGGLGINLRAPGEGSDFVNPNDVNDADTGPNGLQNSPTLTAVTSGSNIIVTATLNAVPNFNYIIDLYRSTGPTAAEVEGQTYVISSAGATGSTGTLTRSFTVPAVGGSFFTATAVANDSGGGVRLNDTSEFSAAVQASAAAPSLVVTTTADTGAGSLRQAIVNANAGSGVRTISFNLPVGQAAGGVWTISPASALPALTTSNVTIDGATQTTFGGNTNTGGPEVVLRGGTAGFSGLTIQGNNNVVKALIINNFLGTGVPDGIVLEGTATGNRIESCYIGTDPQGTAGVPNQYGIFFRGTAHDNTVGGTAALANIIAFNNYNGILNTSTGRGNAFLSNSIFSNGTPQRGLGIDLSTGFGAGDGVTANDAGSPPSTPPDGDTGPNNLQNFPTLSVTHNGTNATINGSLVSTPSTTFRVEYFSSVAPNILGNGEGQTFLTFQNVTTDANGLATLPALVRAIASGSYITATATRTVAPMDTSEFSPAVQALAPATLRADYRFADVFTSSVGTPPALSKIGTGGFATEAVGNQPGANRRVYRFDDNTGLQLSPARPTLGNGTYTLAIIARVDTVSGYNRLVDLSNSTSDSGFYVFNQRLNLFRDGSGTGPLIDGNFYYQWVFTRSPSGVTIGYVNGVPTFNFTDTDGDGALSAANILKLFKDDDAVANEASAGAISRFRVWDGALSAGQVAALDGNPVYTPQLQLALDKTSVAENAGAPALTATVTRTTPTNSPLTVTLASNDTTEANVGGAASQSLVMAQGVKSVTFNINAVDDFLLDGSQTVTFTASAPGATSVTKTLTVTSNDVPGIIVTAVQPLNTTESGGSATFKVRLAAQPASNVTIPLQSSNTLEGTVSPASLVFTSANWNVDRTVTVTGVDDSATDGDVAYTVRLLPATGDASFAGIDAADINAINRDNETPPGLLAWGYNSYGQLGDGSKAHRSTPVRVSGYGIPAAVAAGGGHSIAAGGSARASGYNAGGQLGDATKVDKAAPVAVAGLTNIKAVAAGWYHSLALLNDGTVWAWGYNASGEVGDGTTIDRSHAVRVTGLTGVIAIAAGTYHSAALKSDGTVWTWGNNFYGQLGDGTDDDKLVPVRARVPAATAIACGGAHTLAVAGGQVYSWGWNGDGQLGDGTRNVHILPAVVPGTSGASQVAAGYIHSMALIGTNVRAWGDNEFGQIGNNSNADALSPVLSQVTNVRAIAAGGAHSLALQTGNTLWAWGNNAYGGLGDGSTTNRTVPKPVPGLTNVTIFSGGYAHTLSDGVYTAPSPGGVKTPHVWALSAAAWNAKTRTISLTWAMQMNAERAGDSDNFTVTINGRRIPVNTSYKATTNTTVLTPNEAIPAGSTATVTWNDLAATNGAQVTNGKIDVVVK